MITLILIVYIFFPVFLIGAVFFRMQKYLTYRRYMKKGIELSVTNVKINESDDSYVLEANYECCGQSVHGRSEDILYIDEEKIKRVAAYPLEYTFLADPNNISRFIVSEITMLRKKESMKEKLKKTFIALLIVFVIFGIRILELGMELSAIFDVFGELLRDLGRIG